jgi:hypothetical protein
MYCVLFLLYHMTKEENLDHFIYCILFSFRSHDKRGLIPKSGLKWIGKENPSIVI